MAHITGVAQEYRIIRRMAFPGEKEFSRVIQPGPVDFHIPDGYYLVSVDPSTYWIAVTITGDTDVYKLYPRTIGAAPEPEVGWFPEPLKAAANMASWLADKDVASAAKAMRGAVSRGAQVIEMAVYESKDRCCSSRTALMLLRPARPLSSLPTLRSSSRPSIQRIRCLRSKRHSASARISRSVRSCGIVDTTTVRSRRRTHIGNTTT